MSYYILQKHWQYRILSLWWWCCMPYETDGDLAADISTYQRRKILQKPGVLYRRYFVFMSSCFLHCGETSDANGYCTRWCVLQVKVIESVLHNRPMFVKVASVWEIICMVLLYIDFIFVLLIHESACFQLQARRDDSGGTKSLYTSLAINATIAVRCEEQNLVFVSKRNLLCEHMQLINCVHNGAVTIVLLNNSILCH